MDSIDNIADQLVGQVVNLCAEHDRPKPMIVDDPPSREAAHDALERLDETRDRLLSRLEEDERRAERRFASAKQSLAAALESLNLDAIFEGGIVRRELLDSIEELAKTRYVRIRQAEVCRDAETRLRVAMVATAPDWLKEQHDRLEDALGEAWKIEDAESREKLTTRIESDLDHVDVLAQILEPEFIDLASAAFEDVERVRSGL